MTMTIPIGDNQLRTVDFVWTPSSEDTEDDLARVQLAVASAFFGEVVRPLVVEADLGRCRRGARPGMVASQRRLLASAGYREVVERLPEPNAVAHAEGPHISAAAFTAWVEYWRRTAHATAGDDEVSLRWWSVVAGHTRAPESIRGASTLCVDDRGVSIPVGLQHEPGMTWVAPLPDRLMLQPPLAVSTYNSGFECTVQVIVYWEPWVEEFDRPGSALARAADALVALGWERDDA